MKNKERWQPSTMCNSGGKYKSSANGKFTPEYGVWNSMMGRCYQPEHPSFKRYGGDGVTVALEFHDFQDFARWYKEEYPLMIESGRLVLKRDKSSQRLALDKDIKVPGSKEYGAQTCIFIPKKLNSLFIAMRSNQGNLPLGVTANGSGFVAQCSSGHGSKLVKHFRCVEDAAAHYWKLKFTVVLELCEDEEVDEDLAEMIMSNFQYLKDKHLPDL